MTLEIITAIILFLCALFTGIPTMPGIPFMFIVTLVYGFADRWEVLEPWHVAVFGGIALLSIIVDTFSGVVGAKIGGANRTSLAWGIGGLLIGLVLLPPIGAFIGLFVGVFAAEAVQFKDHLRALRAATTSLVSAVIGMLVNVALAITYFVLFLAAAF